MEKTESKIMQSPWSWSKSYQEQVKVIERIELWGTSNCRVWLPDQDTVALVPSSDIIDSGSVYFQEKANQTEVAYIKFLLMAAQLANLLTEDILLAPIDSNVIPLPHQIKALRKAISRERVRFLLADEVGLGKTIEAGLIMREMKLRGLIKRILVVSPKGLIMQWIAEMKTHFDEEFRYYAPADFTSYRRIAVKDNIWETSDQIICSLDSVKPVESRKGWTDDKLIQFNKDRFQDLVSARWDMVIVDESHRLGGSSDQVARHQLGRGLAAAAPYLLLLSATPHQGKSDAFHRLLTLIDKTAFPDLSSITKERVLPYVIRTEKRQTIDAEGKPLFNPRITKLMGIPWKPEHLMQRQLYDAVTEYVRKGYNQAIKDKKGYIGFLMILMQRLVTSSTRAISTTLERRLKVLHQPQEQMSLFPSILENEWADLDGQDQLESVLSVRLKAQKNERAEVKLLLDAARQVEARGPDAKAEVLLEWLYKLQKEEAEPELKLLIFTEFVPTQQMLDEFLTVRGFSVVCLNGSMDMEQRKRVQSLFSQNVRILISTDAGGEGLNLQFCHVVINYDIPWNPMRLEQRIGRVDRIGQDKIVRAINFIIEDTIEYRVREVLEEKLATILNEFGVDKTSDVLDSAETDHLFENLYIETLLDPASLDAKTQQLIDTIREEANQAKSKNTLFHDNIELKPDDAQQVRNYPLANWIEYMTVNYLDAFGGSLRQKDACFEIKWPNESKSQRAVFPGNLPQTPDGVEILSLEHPRIRKMMSNWRRFAAGRPIQKVTAKDIIETIHGYWSLWQIRMNTMVRQYQRIMTLFLHDDGRNLQPTAKYIWDHMNSGDWQLNGETSEDESVQIYQRCKMIAVEQGGAIYHEMHQKHLNQLQLDQEKAEHSFKSRRLLLDKVGLDQVKAYRLRELRKEEEYWRSANKMQQQVMPELFALIILRVN
jgi:superfamily II DNA or RNA helicase